MKRKTYILGGGTMQPIRNHLALCAPAFGTTARTLKELMPEANLILTKMAAPESNLITNEDVEGYVSKYIHTKLEDWVLEEKVYEERV